MEPNKLSDEDVAKVMKNFTADGGVFNVRFSDGKWQAQGVKGSSAVTGAGVTMGEAVQNVCDSLGFDWYSSLEGESKGA